jgi:predicted RNase H-like HicB family nuclease
VTETPHNKTWKAHVTQEDGWYLITVPDLDVVTQARTQDEIHTMARDLVAITLDIDPENVHVDIAHKDEEEGQE